MTKNDIPESLDVGVEQIVVAADAARMEVERSVAEQLASATSPLLPSAGNASGVIEDPKLFTSDDMMQALENQKWDMESAFAKMKASASESQTSSGAPTRPPQAAFVYSSSEPSLQRGSPYQ